MLDYRNNCHHRQWVLQRNCADESIHHAHDYCLCCDQLSSGGMVRVDHVRFLCLKRPVAYDVQLFSPS